MYSFLQDIRYSLRLFRRTPGVTLIIVLTVALGIGANTVVFSIMESMFLRPLPFAKSERLVVLGEFIRGQGPGSPTLGVRDPVYQAWREQSQAFESIGAYAQVNFNLSSGGRPDFVAGKKVDSGYFTVLGVRPQLGRHFLREEFLSGQNQVALISHDFWQNRLEGRVEVLGQSVTLDGVPHRVIGIMPSDLKLPAIEGTLSQLWVPLVNNMAPAPQESSHLQVIARLKPGVSLAQSRDMLAGIALRLEQQSPETNRGWGVQVENMQDYYSQAMKSPLSVLLLITVTFVLLIACSNVANILLSRGIQRAREMAIRTALGASPKRILRQLLTESLLLSLIGGGLGGLMASWAVDLLRTYMLAHRVAVFDFQMDSRVAGITFLLSLLTGLIFGVLPAWRVSRADPNNALKESALNASAGMSRRRLNNVLVVAQVTLSLVLLISSGVAINSLIRIWQFDWGFVSEKTLIVNLTLPSGMASVNSQRASYFENLVQRLQSLPGVKSVAVADRLPIGFSSNYTKFTTPDQPVPPDVNNAPSAAVRLVNSGYFETFAVHVLAGRKLEAAECFQQRRVALTNETLAKRYWAGKTPIGREIEIQGKTFMVVGIASDRSSHNPMEGPPSEIILPYTVDCPATLSVAIEGTGNLAGLADSVREVVKGSSLYPPIFSLQTLEQERSDFLIVPQFVVGMLTTFAGIALLLATVGLFGLLSLFVSQRTREIGIRMALGAHPKAVILMVLRQGVTLIICGAGLGFLGGFALTRILTSQVYWLKANLPLTCMVMLLFLLLTAILACIVPVRRAVRVSPVEALRFE